MKATFFALVISVSVSLAEESRAESPVQIFGTNWGMTLEIDDTGFYNEVLFMALKDMEGRAEYTVLPYVRALQAFADEPGSCIYSQSIELISELDMMANVGPLIETRSIVDYSGHVFWGKDAAPIRSKEDMRGKRIGQLMGADYDDLFTELNVRPMVVNTETQKTKLLFTRRVDGIIGFIPDIYMVFKANGYQPQPFSHDFVLMRSGNSVVCKQTTATEALVAELDENIKQLRTLGVIDKMLLEAGVPADVIEIVTPQE